MATQPFLPFERAGGRAATRPRRPAGRAAIEALARVCAEQPLEEKVLVSPSLPIGHTLSSGSPARVTRGSTCASRRFARSPSAPSGRPRARGPPAPVPSPGARARRTGVRRGAGRGFVLRTPARSAGPPPRAPAHARRAARRRHLEPAAIPAPRSRTRASRRSSRDPRPLRRAPRRGRFIDGTEVLRAARSRVAASARRRRFSCSRGRGALRPRAARPRSPLGRPSRTRLRSTPPGLDGPRGRGALFRAVGEENEIREVFRRVLPGGSRSTTSRSSTPTSRLSVPRLGALARARDPVHVRGRRRRDLQPARTGRARLSRWIGGGFAADRLREALASGALRCGRLRGRRGRGRSSAGGRARLPPTPDRLGPAPTPFGARPPDRRARRARATPIAPPRSDEAPKPACGRRGPPPRGGRRARDFVRARARARPDGEARTPAICAPSRAAPDFVAEFARVADDYRRRAPAGARLRSSRRSRTSPQLSASRTMPLERLADAVASSPCRRTAPRPGRSTSRLRGRRVFGPPRTPSSSGSTSPATPDADLETPCCSTTSVAASTRRSLARACPRDRARPAPRVGARPAGLRRAPSRIADRELFEFDLRNLSMPGEPRRRPSFSSSIASQPAERCRLWRHARRPSPRRGLRSRRGSALDEREWWLARLAGAVAPGPGGRPAGSGRVPLARRTACRRAARAVRDLTRVGRTPERPPPELDPRRLRRPDVGVAGPVSRTALLVLHPSVLRSGARRPRARPHRWLEPREEGSLLHESSARSSRTRRPRRETRPRDTPAPSRGVAAERSTRGAKGTSAERGRLRGPARDDPDACRTFLGTSRSPPARSHPAGSRSDSVCARRRRRGGIASAEPVEIPARPRERASPCADRSIASTKRRTGASTSGTTRPEAPLVIQEDADCTAAARSSPRSPPWPSRRS